MYTTTQKYTTTAIGTTTTTYTCLPPNIARYLPYLATYIKLATGTGSDTYNSYR